MVRRVVPKKTVERVKRSLATKKFIEDIAKSEGVSVLYVRQLNMRHGIRPIFEKKKKISERKRRFIKKALALAKYTSMGKIAKRAGVSKTTVQTMNLSQGIRNKKALHNGRIKIPGKKFEQVVEALIKHPKWLFAKIAKQCGVTASTVSRINKRLRIQSKEHIEERTITRRKEPRKKRHYLFSQEEKWKIIQENTFYIVGAISKFAVPGNIQIPIDELTQETKLRAFNGLDLLAKKEDAAKYIQGIAKFTTLGYMKKESKKLGMTWKAFERMITKKKIRGK